MFPNIVALGAIPVGSDGVCCDELEKADEETKKFGLCPDYLPAGTIPKSSSNRYCRVTKSQGKSQARESLEVRGHDRRCRNPGPMHYVS